MSEGTIHSDNDGFEEFVQMELNALAQRAEEQDICIDCLTDRIIVELVAGLTRAGISARDILSMVLDGLELAEASEEDERNGPPRRMH